MTFEEAKQTCKRPPEQQVRQRPNQQFKGLENTHIDFMLLQDGDTLRLPQRIRLHLRHHNGNPEATRGQRGTGTRGNLHPGVNSDFCSSFQMSVFYFACRKVNLLAIDGRCEQYTVRAHVFLMRILSACLSQLVVAVV